MPEHKKYSVRATKARTGTKVTGTALWDGIASVLSVTTEDGKTVYVRTTEIEQLKGMKA